jgi:DNA-binding CsgD family transcriptional regulator
LTFNSQWVLLHVWFNPLLLRSKLQSFGKLKWLNLHKHRLEVSEKKLLLGDATRNPDHTNYERAINMHKLVLKENDIFLTSSTIINELCRPLGKLGIDYFTYLKNFKDGSQVNLSNSARWIEHYYNFKLYNTSWFESHPENYDSGYIIWPSESNLEVFKHGRDYFDSGNGITIIKKSDLYIEFFFFSGSNRNKWLNNIYINNIDVLKNFTLYFKDKLKDIIDEADKSRILIPHNNRDRVVEEIEVLDLYQKELFELKSIITGKDVIDGEFTNSPVNRNIVGLLTPREIEVVKSMLNGKTAKETAKQLAIAPKTVENHIDKIREKLRCRNKFELVRKILNDNYVYL